MSIQEVNSVNPGSPDPVRTSDLEPSLMAGQVAILEKISLGATLPEVLEDCLRLCEGVIPDMLCSILILDSGGTRLRHGAAPRLPKAYTSAIDGASIGPMAGSCGTAAYRREPVYVEDISTDPLWTEYRALALPHGLRSCWSTPIFDSERKVLGTFAIYYKRPALPEPMHRRIIAVVTHLAAIAISCKRTKEALAAREAHLRAIIEAEPEGVQVVSPDGVLLEMNPAGMRMFEAETLEEARAKPLEDYIAPEHKAPFRDLQRRVMAGEGGSLAFGFTSLKGTRLWLESHAVPMRDASGAIERILCITRDITGRVEAEEKLRQNEKLTAIGQLAGGIAHDFNNQLSVILGYAELLASRLKDPETRRYADSIAQAARGSGDLTRNLLTFSRRGHFETVPVDIHDLLREVGDLLLHSIDRRISIHLRLHAARPVLLADPASLQNALLNLSLNARDAMPKGGSLEFRTDETLNEGDPDPLSPDGDLSPGSYLRIEVSDTGTGMTEAVRKRIFEPFFTTKPVGKGTGMGLASVFGTVKMHRGRIRVESEPGKGTRFCILLPLAGLDALRPAEPEAQPRPGLSLRILAVDDDPAVRGLVLDLLHAAGHQAIGAADGKDALAQYQESWRKLDLVLLDMVMPEMDGEDTFHALRRVNPGAKVVILSGYSPDGKVQGLLAGGAAGFLRKPFSLADLDKVLVQATLR